MKIHGHKNKRTGEYNSWEVGRVNVGKKRKAGTFVPTLEEALELRQQMEAQLDKEEDERYNHRVAQAELQAKRSAIRH